jgi:predicted transcriptional regulator
VVVTLKHYSDNEPLFGPFTLPRTTLSRTLKAIEVRFKPDLQAKLDELANETGRPTDELVEDVVAGYFDELVHSRDTLNSRYDDLKSGRVKPISRDEVCPVPRKERRNSRDGQSLGRVAVMHTRPSPNINGYDPERAE